MEVGGGLVESQLVGLDYLAAITALLQRIRNAHPTKGLYEAADHQFWWRIPRSTDHHAQLFWHDRDGRPEAALIATDWSGTATTWSDVVTIAPTFLPDASPELMSHVVRRGLAHLEAAGSDLVELEVAQTDEVLRQVLKELSFEIKTPDVLVEAWLAAQDRPDISPLPADYRLNKRIDMRQREHHMSARNGPETEARLQQTSLYRADLDLCIVDAHDNYAALGLFWFDPTTATGLVEPMRTEDDHQRRGLARCVLTAGIDLLAGAGAERIKVCFEPDNAAAAQLYLSAGFEPVKRTDMFSGRVSA